MKYKEFAVRHKNAKKDAGNEKSRKQLIEQLDAATLHITSLKNQLQLVAAKQAPLTSNALNRTSPRRKRDIRIAVDGSTDASVILAGVEVFSPDSVPEDVGGGSGIAGQPGGTSPTWSLSEILAALEKKGQVAGFYVDQSNTLVHLLKMNPLLKYDLKWRAFGPRIQGLLSNQIKEVSAAGFRVARYTIGNVDSIKQLRSFNLDFFVIRSLSRDLRSNVDREQALRVIRAYLAVKDGVYQISHGVIRAIAAVAEFREDKLSHICAETLGEIMVLCPQLAFEGGAFRPILSLIESGPHSLTSSLIFSLVYALEMPERRKLINDGRDLDVILTPFTESRLLPQNNESSSSKAHADIDALRNTADIVRIILYSWTGIYGLFGNGSFAARSLVDALKGKNASVSNCLLDLLSSIFHIPPNDEIFDSEEGHEHSPGRTNVLNMHTAVLLIIFLEAGLLEAVSKLVYSAELKIAHKATRLIDEIGHVAARTLPPKYASLVLPLESLMESASLLGKPEHAPASSSLMEMDTLNRRRLHKASSARESRFGLNRVRMEDAHKES